MKTLMVIAGLLITATVVADSSVTFSQYKVSTEVAADLARQCRVEIQSEYGQRCERFYNHMENHMALYTQFNNRVASEGKSAYGGADSVDRSMHQRTVSQLMENMQYINTMTELQM